MKKHYLALIALLISFASIAQVGPITGTPLSICVGDMTTLSCTPPGGTWSSSAPGTATVGTAGDVLGVSAGIATITYAIVGGIATVDVTVNPVPVLSCGSTGMCSVCAGDSTLITSSIPGGTWTSGTPSVATVGSTGMVTGVSGGTSTITYTLPTGCFATATITVNPAPTLYCVTSNCAYCAGGTGCPIGLSGSQVGVMYTLMNGITVMGGPTAGTGGPLSWGLMTMAGTYTVTAFNPSTGCRNTTICNATITINPNPVVSGGGTTVGVHVCVGSTIPLTASITGGTWTSANTSIATVGSASGVVTGIAAGVTTITYTLPTGCIGTISVTVDPLPTIVGTLVVCAGSSTLLTGTPGGGTWTSVGTVASVGSSSGIVNGITAGTEVITYMTPAGCVRTVVVTVNPLPVIAGTSTICVSATSTFTGAPGGGTWTSSNPGVATVNPSSGTVTGVTAGTSVITYTLTTGCYKTMSVNIITAPAPITCTGGGSAICAVCVLGTITVSSTTPGGVWSSSTPAVATIGSSSGVVTGVSAGITTITYSLGGGCFTTAIITVNPLPAPILGPNIVCAGFNITLTNASPGGTWTSTGTVASVGATTGLVTGLVAGVETITYTLPTGCATTYNVTVNPLPCPALGVEQALKTGVAIFPNPAHDEITISMMESAFNSLTITNNIGQVVIQLQLVKGVTSVNIKTLPSAIYYATFRGDNGIIVKRFIKD